MEGNKVYIEHAFKNGKKQGMEEVADYIENCDISIPIEKWVGTKKDLIKSAALILAQQIRDKYGLENKK